MKKILPQLFCLIAPAVTSHAATISVNFTDNGSAASTMAPTDTAGASQVSGARVTNWNNYAANGATQAAAALAVDSDGNAITTTVAYAGALGSHRLPETQATPNGDDRMWKGNLDIATGATVTVANIPYATYNVVVYFDGDNAGNWRAASYNINGGTARVGEDSENTNWKKGTGQNAAGIYQAPVAGGTGNVAFTGTGVGNNNEGNYVVFTGITGSSFTLNAAGSVSADVNLRAPINGFQIIQVPEPTSALLVAFSAFAFLRRRRA